MSHGIIAAHYFKLIKFFENQKHTKSLSQAKTVLFRQSKAFLFGPTFLLFMHSILHIKLQIFVFSEISYDLNATYFNNRDEVSKEL
mgnify:CR=1 FL=1